MIRPRLLPALVPVLALMLPLPALGAPMTLSFIKPSEWATYLEAYVAEDGRVIDSHNRSVSHSESQGYGLLLSFLAQDRVAFARIWSFTRAELMIRDDGLAAWLWDPDADPHVTDVNNATDGDILIAYALALAGNGWGDRALLEDARAMATTIGDNFLAPAGDIEIILPGAQGFSAADREDGPVANPSYWVFEAFPVFAALTPEIDWMGVSADGLTLVERLVAPEGALPADWVSLAGETPVPAADFPPEFGYNNIRIPLYLVRAEMNAQTVLSRFAAAFDETGALWRTDVATGERLEALTEPGYRLLGATIDCVLGGAPIPAELQTFAPTSYYAATLQLLALDHLRRHHAPCLRPEVP